MKMWLEDKSDEAEYNQHYLVINEVKFFLSSDRDAEIWNIEYPNGNIDKLQADNITDAKQEASNLIGEWSDD